MVGTVQHYTDTMDADRTAAEIASLWEKYRSDRADWTDQKKNLRNYIFQTDTTDTSGAYLPWKNSTVTPKICQIRDNLHANYMAALFPKSEWLTWEGSDAESQKLGKLITSYLLAKINQSDFEEVISRLVLDYIDYGNCFAEARYRVETHKDGGEITYQGPYIERISPFDIMFNLNARTFSEAPKVTRYFLSLGQLEKIVREEFNDSEWATKALAQMTKVRSLELVDNADFDKSEGFKVDGFSSLTEYLQSGMVEVLEFEGDIYSEEAEKYLHGYRIIVVDRSYIAHMAPIDAHGGRSMKHHIGWRLRPDNLMAMGPLDNLIGLQYRIDHLENLKADVFDQIAHPVVLEKGFVDEWTWGPGQKIVADENADVQILRPESQALTADFQIQNLMAIMEEMAGAPKQAMGIRTPGEKTAFEVQQLENAAGRIFQSKVAQFERMMLEPLLNDMLDISIRSMQGADVIRSEDAEFGNAVSFQPITASMLSNRGKLRAKGARHFAERANIVQTLNALGQSGLYQDPDVRNHISAVELARKFVEASDLPEPDRIVSPNIRIAEQAETAKTMQAGQKQVMENAAIQPELETGGPEDG